MLTSYFSLSLQVVKNNGSLLNLLDLSYVILQVCTWYILVHQKVTQQGKILHFHLKSKEITMT